MLFREVITAYSAHYKKSMHILYWKVQFLNVKADDNYSYQYAYRANIQTGKKQDRKRGRNNENDDRVKHTEL
jgi:hypothetical protein